MKKTIIVMGAFLLAALTTMATSSTVGLKFEDQDSTNAEALILMPFAEIGGFLPEEAGNLVLYIDAETYVADCDDNDAEAGDNKEVTFEWGYKLPIDALAISFGTENNFHPDNDSDTDGVFKFNVAKQSIFDKGLNAGIYSETGIWKDGDFTFLKPYIEYNVDITEELGFAIAPYLRYRFNYGDDEDMGDYWERGGAKLALDYQISDALSVYGVIDGWSKMEDDDDGNCKWKEESEVGIVYALAEGLKLRTFVEYDKADDCDEDVDVGVTLSYTF